jgi:hypothetical protein
MSREQIAQEIAQDSKPEISTVREILSDKTIANIDKHINSDMVLNHIINGIYSNLSENSWQKSAATSNILNTIYANPEECPGKETAAYRNLVVYRDPSEGEILAAKNPEKAMDKLINAELNKGKVAVTYRE